MLPNIGGRRKLGWKTVQWNGKPYGFPIYTYHKTIGIKKAHNTLVSLVFRLPNLSTA
jgi:hypothetical protein